MRARAFVELTKPGILQLLVLTTICAMFVAERGVPELGLMFWTLLGTVLVCGSANSINMVWDRDIDGLMGRTAHRPIVTGRVTPREALVWATVLGLTGLAVLAYFANPLAALMGLSGHLFYVVIYTMLLKRRTPQNIVIGGAAGAFPPLIGYAAVAGSLDLAAWIIFAIIFLWTPPHFWALALYKKTDYAAANVPMMPVARGRATTKRQMVFYMVLLLAATTLLTVVGTMGAVYGVAAVGLGAGFGYCVLRTLSDETDRWARRTFAFSIIYLGLLFGAMSADSIYSEPMWPSATSGVAVRRASELGATRASQLQATADDLTRSSREIASAVH
jgi:protoheme IX farnesyltransferase